MFQNFIIPQLIIVLTEPSTVLLVKTKAPTASQRMHRKLQNTKINTAQSNAQVLFLRQGKTLHENILNVKDIFQYDSLIYAKVLRVAPFRHVTPPKSRMQLHFLPELKTPFTYHSYEIFIT